MSEDTIYFYMVLACFQENSHQYRHDSPQDQAYKTKHTYTTTKQFDSVFGSKQLTCMTLMQVSCLKSRTQQEP